MTVCIYEDDVWRHFLPLTWFRPVYTLRTGLVPLFERLAQSFSADSVCLAARDQVAGLLGETLRDFPVNIIKRTRGDVLFLNGRIRRVADLPQLVQRSRFSTVFMTTLGDVVGVLFKEDLLESLPEIAIHLDYLELFDRMDQDIPPTETKATLYSYIWELVDDISASIVRDFEHLRPSLQKPKNVKVHEGACLDNEDDIFLGNGVELRPSSVVDASRGPVYIGDQVRVEPHATIVGPCFIGPNTVVLAGNVAESSIGHTCRVGGEVEGSVFHSYVNKYHAGFIGHSYVGPWVNFGAMTTNSDLKNNYSAIRVVLDGVSHDTGSIKVGSFIGDHTKFGIGTLLTTGITIGVCCNIFGGDLVADKEVSSFSWGTTGNYTQYRLVDATETARIVAARRDATLSDAEIGLFEVVFRGSVIDDGVMKFVPR